jgi:predicted HTH domain antitoxin
MIAKTIAFPERVFSAIRLAPDDFISQMRLAAAVAWYEQGRISQEVAANIAGTDRTDFLLSLAKMGKDSFQIDFCDLDREIARG